MNVLELFSGSRSIGKVCDARGYNVFSTDINAFDNIDYVIDILNFDPNEVPFIPDVIWASPPCQGFSVAAIGKNWVKGEPFTPKTDSARLGIKLVQKTLDIIEHFTKLNPDLIYYIENPRGKLRKAPFMEALPYHHCVTYCQYGDDRMKPTDIWTNNRYWKSKKACKNGMSCHVSAPRGSQTGTQGLKGDYERSKVPQELCEEVLTACLHPVFQNSQIKHNFWGVRKYMHSGLSVNQFYEHTEALVTALTRAIDLVVDYKCKGLECDGTSRVINHIASSYDVDLTAKCGSICKKKGRKIVDGFDPHFWLEIIIDGDTYIIDYRARMWMGENAPHGIFKEEFVNDQNWYYNGEQVWFNERVSELL